MPVRVIAVRDETMKNASQWALVSSALVLGMAYACATPVEIHDCPLGASAADCDVLLYQPSDFETADAGVRIGAGGSEVSPSGGSAGINQTPPAGGAAGTGSPPSGGSAGQGVAGSGQSAGAGGASGGSGGTAGSGAGTGGVAGTAGSSAAGAGGTTAQSNFNPAACNFNVLTGCEALACASACPANNSNCLARCPQIITCVSGTPSCITEADPMCGVPITSPMFMNNVCTSIVQQSGNVDTTDPNAPAFRARALIQCLCDDTRL
jgi:hypothetical protein